MGQMCRHLEENEDWSLAKTLQQQPKIQIVTEVKSKTKNMKVPILKRKCRNFFLNIAEQWGRPSTYDTKLGGHKRLISTIMWNARRKSQYFPLKDNWEVEGKYLGPRDRPRQRATVINT